ncbi:MAG: DUF4340 domain-containing protein [Acidobacteriota bacterium]
MRGLWSTLGLGLVLAGLGAYIYFVDADRPAPGSSTKEKVFTVESDAIEEVTLTSDQETTTLRKADGTWTMTAPVKVDADQTEMSTVTSSLASLEINRVVEENASDLSQYGLADPRIEVSFKAKDGVAGSLRLGDKTATQSDVYAARPGESRVFLVQAYQESSFAKKTFDLRDKRILRFERDKVDAMEIAQAGSPPIVLARAGSEWVLKQPVQTRGDYSAIEGLLTRLSTANMSRIVEPPADEAGAKALGFDKPNVVVTLGAGSTKATLALGKEEDGAAYARDEGRGLVFAIEPSLLTDLRKTSDEYRHKDLFEFRSFNADRLRIVRGADTYEFEKVPASGDTSEKWQRVTTGGPATDVDSTKMGDLLSRLSGLRAQSFRASRHDTGLDRAPLVVSASYDAGKFERIRLATVGKEAFGMRDQEPGAAVLDANAYDEAVKALDAVLAPAAPAASKN